MLHPQKTVLFKVITCEDCSNTAYLETVLGEKEETIKNSLNGHWGMHPIDTPANGSPLHRTPCDTAGITLMLQPWHLHLTWTYNLLGFLERDQQKMEKIKGQAVWWLLYHLPLQATRRWVFCDDILHEHAATVSLTVVQGYLNAVPQGYVLLVMLGPLKPKLLNGYRWW